MNWTRLLYQTLYKCGKNLGKVNRPSYMSPFLYHYYDYFNVLTNSEMQLYRAASTQVQAQLVQVTPLRPNSPRMVSTNQFGAPLQLANPSHPSGSNKLQRQAWTRDTGEGSDQPGGSQQPLPEPRPSSPASPRDSIDSAERDKSSEEYTPSIRSSAGAKDGSPGPLNTHLWYLTPDWGLLWAKYTWKRR